MTLRACFAAGGNRPHPAEERMRLSSKGSRRNLIHVIETGALRGRPPRDHRRTLDAVFWIARTGAWFKAR